jgi:hypothetical protein
MLARIYIWLSILPRMTIFFMCVSPAICCVVRCTLARIYFWLSSLPRRWA